jgi:hypothetical protein
MEAPMSIGRRAVTLCSDLFGLAYSIALLAPALIVVALWRGPRRWQYRLFSRFF